MNFAGPNCPPSPLGIKMTETIKNRKPIEVMKKKWVDDLVILTAVNLKDKAVFSPSLCEDGPLPYHSRTQHILPEKENRLQQEASILSEYAKSNFMQINQTKTKVAIFNPLSKIDIMPKISFDGENLIEVVEEYKLLGQIISTDMKTLRNTKNILKKAYLKMYMLHRLNELGCQRKDMIDFLKLHILSIAEQAVPHWGPMITKSESHMIEGILKTALHIILKDEYVSFKHALKITNLKSLASRRKDIIFKFANRAQNSERFREWFKKAEHNPSLRHRQKDRFKEVTCRTTRFSRSSIPVLTKAISWHPPKIYISPEVY